MLQRFLYIFLMLGLNASTTQAQHPYAWDLTVEDGLPSLEVYDLYQDSKGYMWIGTDKGLCRYNGNEFFYYHNKEELSEALSGIQEDPEGRIWVRNFKDQIFYVEEDSLHYFEIPQKITIQDFLVDTRGSIWVIDRRENTLYCYSDNGEWESWEVYNEKTTLNEHGLMSIIEGGDSTIYVTSSGGLFQLSERKMNFITDKNLARTFTGSKSLAPISLFKDKENTLFLLQNLKGQAYQVSQLIGNDLGIVWNSFREAFYDRESHALRVDEDNTIWQLTKDGGLGPLFNSSATSKLDSTLLLFPNEGVSDFVIDREGSYWISSLSKGVHIVPSLKIEKYTNSVLNSYNVGLIEKKDDETFFFSTEVGKVCLYNVNESKIEEVINVEKDKFSELSWEGNMLLVNSTIWQNRYHVSSGNNSKNVYSMLDQNIRSSFIYKKNGIVNLKERGACIFSLSKKNKYDYFSSIDLSETKKQGTTFVYKILTDISSFCGLADEDNDRILIARDDSLICYPESSRPFSILDEEGKAIRGIYMERSANGTIWICTVNSGIYALNRALNVTHHFTVQEGLINNKIKKLKIDGDNLWLLSAHGIQCFNPQTEESRIYTKEDGLPTHEIKDIAILKDKVWLSTAKGVVSFDKNLSSKNLIPPSIYLKRIEVHDKNRGVASTYKLNYQENSLTIHVEGVTYKNRGNFQYKYRMLGIDSSWIAQASAINVMRFPQLNPGTYTFQVKAMNEDGVESNEIIDVQFVIDKPYWQLWWAQGLFYLTIVLIIVAVVLTRVRNKQREEQQQNEMNVLRMQALQSQMNPHFIFNVLTAVQNLWLQHKNELAMEMQSSFAKLLRKIFQNSSKKVISMAEIKDFLDNYLNLEQIRFEYQVQIDFEIEEELLEGYFIPSLLIQPIIENSFKHGLFHKSANRELKIVLKKEGVYVYCLVEDNGVGRPTKINVEKTKRSSGLTTTKKRLLILQHDVLKELHPHNNFKITDLKNSKGGPEGTKVELWIPFVTTSQ